MVLGTLILRTTHIIYRPFLLKYGLKIQVAPTFHEVSIKDGGFQLLSLSTRGSQIFGVDQIPDRPCWLVCCLLVHPDLCFSVIFSICVGEKIFAKVKNHQICWNWPQFIDSCCLNPHGDMGQDTALFRFHAETLLKMGLSWDKPSTNWWFGFRFHPQYGHFFCVHPSGCKWLL